MNAETIKDFLISLGFEIDSSGERKFSAVVAGVTANVIKMGAAVEGAALTIVGFTTQIASGLDKVYFASQRTGASVAGIRALGYAAAQTGSDAAAAQGSLESLARFIRNNPGAEGFLNRLGVQTRGANGQMRDTAAIFTGVGDKLRSMPYYRANQYAQMLGIDENTLIAMRRGINGFTADYQSMLKAVGLNADRAAQQSNKFMTSMRSLTALLGMAKDKIGSDLAGGLSGSLDTLRRRIMDNFPKIEGFITKTVKGVLWLAEVFGRMLYRGYQAIDKVIEWWKGLDTESRKLIGVFGALLVAWRLLNSAFLMSPIGMITALVVGIGLLWDDYQTWKEGGKSLIDWAKWEPAITQAKAAMVWLRDKLLELKDAVGGWKTALEILAGFVAVSWAAKMVSAIGSVTKSVGGLSKAMGGLGKVGVIGGLLAIEEAVVKPLEGKYSWLTDNPVANLLNRLPGSDTVDAWGRKLLPWRQGEAAQHGQSVRRPQATKAGAALLGWLQPKLTQLEALYNLPAGLLRSVALTESGGNQFAVSGAGAKGLFQFMPGTARDMGLRGDDVFDPSKSAAAAARYLGMLLRMNGGDLDKTLASYNWGIGNVQKHGMDLMPAETRNYIPKVRSNMPGAGGATVQQETNIHIHGVSDPARAGMEVADRQTGVNSRLTQQLYARPQ
ncbi:lytic transglycosylase domain-containing protein [Serratia ficaria]|uniref:lytic transglycosylase domain-containing protein n=1 Tax=Serratia ficaria TaxID=61651 RepID=UPI000E24A209|nr:lytic transglycosylase domain-containing protein [Serratia ficaria]REF42087.1 transglycosylase-like protein with SLT domain [Serratia ficaria]CAI0823309.1 Membrane-bound lytic murein transglycosylase D precursor [Serratia ficaria]CAI1050014.1 Membrane-bound lytic murein transglycosylase D precursor [Serratia ficaria]CAI1101305.1 Membrane-bound lytic murein transglycosylase D precursor [Serratia ficaria]CAI1196213.1 Membrane-bound lytic murein transglycosylase D precursor [Serratia ficaria]